MKSEKGKKSLREQLGTYYALGLLIVIPTSVCVWVLWTVFVKVDNILGQIFRRMEWHVPGLGFVAINVLILALGVIAGNVFGRHLILMWEALLKRIPLVNKIYTATYQISEAFLGKQEKKIFSRVALVEFPRPGTYAVGFITSTAVGEVQEKTAQQVCSVFIPTTPNPTSGFLVLEPEERVIKLDMSVEDAIKFVISAGSLTPAYPAPGAGRP
jgi:uncharacterized membrane protein